MAIYEFEGQRPTIAASAYVAPSALIIGRVSIGEGCYIGHGAIIRGDYGAIEIGDETAIEEGVIIHARPGDWTRIGRRATVGHGAMIHNATILDGAVIGMRAVVSDFSEVGAGAIVGELGLVKNRQQIPAQKVAVGVPARVVGDVDHRHRDMTHWAKDLYVDLARRYAAGALVEIEAPCSAEGEALAATQPPRLPPMAIIGIIRTPFGQPSGAPFQGGLAKQVEGEILIDPAYLEGLADLEGFSHIVLLFAFHHSQGHRLTVTPHLDPTPRGLFATRAPRRPSPLGMTVVRLIEVTGRRLRVSGVDMLDGTPLLDIKPHVPAFDCPKDARIGWLEGPLQNRDKGDGQLTDDRLDPLGSGEGPG